MVRRVSSLQVDMGSDSAKVPSGKDSARWPGGRGVARVVGGEGAPSGLGSTKCSGGPNRMIEFRAAKRKSGGQEGAERPTGL